MKFWVAKLKLLFILITNDNFVILTETKTIMNEILILSRGQNKRGLFGPTDRRTAEPQWSTRNGLGAVHFWRCSISTKCFHWWTGLRDKVPALRDGAFINKLWRLLQWGVVVFSASEHWVGFRVGLGKPGLEPWGVRLHSCTCMSLYFVVEACFGVNICFCGPASLGLAQYSKGYE